MMRPHKTNVQLIWGCALLFVGAMLFFRISGEVVPKIEQIAFYEKLMPYIKLCLYIISIFLMGGGVMKIYAYYRKESPGNSIDD